MSGNQGPPEQAAVVRADSPSPQHELNQSGEHDHLSPQQHQADTPGNVTSDDQHELDTSDEDIAGRGFETGSYLNTDMMTEDLKRIKLNPRDVKEFLDRYRPLWDPKTRSAEDYFVTPLHILARDLQPQYDIALVRLFIESDPDIMVAKNYVRKTAMHVAVEHRNYAVLDAMYKNFEDMDQVLRIPDSDDANCLHLAIHKRLKRQTVLDLIKKASPDTLCGQDERGCTPLHLAVDYMICTDAQLDVVKELLVRGENALDSYTKDGMGLSVYQYHLQTRDQKLTEITANTRPSTGLSVLGDNGIKANPGHRPINARLGIAFELVYQPLTCDVSVLK